MVEIIAKDVPAEIVRALVGEARSRNQTVTDLAAGILASRFNVEREPSGRSFIAGMAGSDTLILSVPAELRKAIRRYAVENDATMRGVVIDTLARHFGMPAVPTGRRPRGR